MIVESGPKMEKSATPFKLHTTVVNLKDFPFG